MCSLRSQISKAHVRNVARDFMLVSRDQCICVLEVNKVIAERVMFMRVQVRAAVIHGALDTNEAGENAAQGRLTRTSELTTSPRA